MMSHGDEDFLNFCQLIIDVEQFHTVAFMTGSMAEVAGNENSLNQFSSADSIDVDLMFYRRDLYVFSSTDDVPSVYRSNIIRYFTDGIHPGYVRLLLESDGSEVARLYDGRTVATLNDAIGEHKRSGPAVTYEKFFELKHCNLTEEQARSYVTKKDMVFAHHHPCWPHEAVEWITRQRSRGSLSNDVIRRVVGYGCDFVCVSHKGYIQPDKHHEWRFSFTMAELVLVKNWSRQQRTMYRTIRVLHKSSLKIGQASRLCTYHYKTLMLWAVETESPCFWNDVMLFDSVRAVLVDMIHCLKIKCLYHYFIPTNNLFDHLLSEDLSDDVNALLCICEDTVSIREVLTTCMNEEIFMSCKKAFITVPQMLYNSINLATYLGSPPRRFGDTFRLSIRGKTQLQNCLSDELKTAYGLLSVPFLEQRNVIPDSVTESYNWCFNGLQYYVYNKCVKNESLIKMFSINESFTQRFVFYYPEMDIPINNKSWLLYCELAAVEDGISKMPTSTTQMKHVLYCRSELWIFSNASMMAFNSTGNVEHQETDTLDETDVKCLKDLTLTSCDVCPIRSAFKETASYREFKSSLSPTVPISWFINKAYTANNYYILLSDYKTTVEICDEIINAYNTSDGNNEFSERGLPFLLSTQWIDMYDIELRQMLGLVTLCRSVIYGSDNRTVHLPSCPVQFALYLKVRCIIDSEGVSDKTMTACVEFARHYSTYCRDEQFRIYGVAALHASLIMHTLAALPSKAFATCMLRSMNK